MKTQFRNICWIILGFMVLSSLLGGSVSAQNGDADVGFPLGAATAYCNPGYGGVFDGCSPWDGVTVSFVSADATYSNSCVTSGADRAAGCGVDVPFGSKITASIDPASIPAGYVLEGPSSLVFTIPDVPPEGLFGGPVFVLLPSEVPVESFSLTSFSAFCEPGYLGVFDGCTPWDGVTISFTSVDATYSNSCVTVAGDRTASCVVEVPFGWTITASIDPSTIPAGYVLEGAAVQELSIPDALPDGMYSGPSFVLLPAPVAPTEGPATEVPIADPSPVSADPTEPEPVVVSLPSTGVGSTTATPLSRLLLMTSVALLGVGLTIQQARREA